MLNLRCLNLDWQPQLVDRRACARYQFDSSYQQRPRVFLCAGASSGKLGGLTLPPAKLCMLGALSKNPGEPGFLLYQTRYSAIALQLISANFYSRA